MSPEVIYYTVEVVCPKSSMTQTEGLKEAAQLIPTATWGIDHRVYILLVIRPSKYQDLSLAVRVPLINVKQGLRHTLDMRDVLSAQACAGSNEVLSSGAWEGRQRGPGCEPEPRRGCLGAASLR